MGVGACFAFQAIRPVTGNGLDVGHDAAPILAITFLPMGIIFTLVGFFAMRLSGNRNQLMQTGLAGQATIQSVAETGAYINERPRGQDAADRQCAGPRPVHRAAQRGDPADRSWHDHTGQRPAGRGGPHGSEQAGDRLGRADAGTRTGCERRDEHVHHRTWALPSTGISLAMLELNVTPDGGAPYPARVTALVPPASVGRAVVGGSLPVFIDNSNPQNLAIDWDAA
jgi:hypothetical protein